MKLEANKWYITAGGYLVNIRATSGCTAQATAETSPCLSFGNWTYNIDGTISRTGLDEELKIVAEYPHPVKLPEGYAWKGGYPKLFEYKQLDPEDYFISSSGLPSIAKQTSSFGTISVMGNKRIGLVKETPSKTAEAKLTLEANKWYITKSGYLVFIEKISTAFPVASSETSAGVNKFNETALGAFEGRRGWQYNHNGTVDGLKDNDGMTIVAEYPHPVKLPDGYKWKEEFPKLYEAKDIFNDHFMMISGTVLLNDTKESFDDDPNIGRKRIGLVRVDTPPKSEEVKLMLEVGKWYVTKGNYLVNIVSKDKDFFVASIETSPGQTVSGKTAQQLAPCDKGWYYNGNKVRSMLSLEWAEALEIVAEYPYPVDLPKGFKWKDGYPKLYTSQELGYSEFFLSDYGYLNYTQESFTGHGLGKQKSFPCLRVINDKRIGLVPVKESEEMKKETAIAAAKIAGNLGFRALNYWFFEPAVNTFRPIVKGVRYAVFIGTLTGAVYGYKHPEVVKNALMSCLPKVSIEAPEILR